MNWKLPIYLSLQRLIGANAGKFYREFMALETASVKDVQAIQEAALERLMFHATKNVPYYCARIEPKTGLRLADFPVLTKEDIRANFSELMTSKVRSEYASKARNRRYSWLSVQTGGSTGMPTTVIHGAQFRDRSRAARLYVHYLCGFPFGMAHFRLWGSMREINQMKESCLQRVQSHLSGEVVLNAFKMDEERMQRYVKEVNASKVLYMMAYVDAAYALARYAKDRRISLRRLESIMACAGTLTPDLRVMLHSVWGARIHNLYGSRDCGAMACECRNGGFHILSNRVVIEVVDEHGNPLPRGRPGRILVTLLNNWEFPLIRYEIGDIASLSPETCTCGRPFPLLGQLEGRSVEFLQDVHGGYVSPVYIRHLVGVVHNPGLIRKFQLVQCTPTDFQLRVVTDCLAESSQFQALVANLDRDLRAVLGQEANIQVISQDDLQPSPSGKFLYTLNMCAPRLV
jgi:phenylacetate-CoA ligase